MLSDSILGIAAGRCVANGATASANPDPFTSFSLIVLLGESENRLSCILASIPMFWPAIEQAAERFHELYRVFITQEFIVGSSRMLPGEARIEIGAYEAPHWAEQDEEASAGRSLRGDSVEGSGAREKDGFPTMSEMCLPQWPNSVQGSWDGSSERIAGSEV